MPPLAAFIIKLLSAELSFPFDAGAFLAGLGFTSEFAPVRSGGYWFNALLVRGRQTRPIASTDMIPTREIIRCFFIILQVDWLPLLGIRDSHVDAGLDVQTKRLFDRQD